MNRQIFAVVITKSKRSPKEDNVRCGIKLVIDKKLISTFYLDERKVKKVSQIFQELDLHIGNETRAFPGASFRIIDSILVKQHRYVPLPPNDEKLKGEEKNWNSNHHKSKNAEQDKGGEGSSYENDDGDCDDDHEDGGEDRDGR